MKKAKLSTVITVSALFNTMGIIPFHAQASDHIDGPITTKARQADLTDFYAFPTPNKPGFLSLILNSYPVVAKSGHMTDKAIYSFVIRKAEIVGKSEHAKVSTSSQDEIRIDCHVQTPNDITKHRITCKSTNGLKATSVYNTVSEIKPGDDFRLYAGMRSDPFFFNAEFAQKAAAGELIGPMNSNIMEGINVLSIIIEIETNKLFPSHPTGLLALATQITPKESTGDAPQILDRIGRPEVTNVSMFTPKDEEELRDLYNTDRPFNVSEDHLNKYRTRLLRNIKHYDSLDKKQNISEKTLSALVNLLVDDFLVVDLNKPCREDSYFEIEKSLLKGQDHTTCGSRHPHNDIMDTLFTLYIRGLDGDRVRDGVDAPSKVVANEFPYLAEPELSLSAQLKGSIARICIEKTLLSFLCP